MTAILAPPIVFQGLGFGGLPLPGGKLFSYVAGTSTPQPTWTDSTQLEQNLNPVILNANGQAAVWLDPTLTYKFILQDQFGNQVGVAADNVQGFLTAAALSALLPALLAAIITQSYIGALLYPQTPAELAAGVIPVNIWYPPGYVLRYGSNTVPGTTDMTAAIQAAINQFYNGGNAVFFSCIPGSGFPSFSDYRITSAINITSFMEMRGEVQRMTAQGPRIVQSSNGLSCFTVTGNTAISITVEDLAFAYTGASAVFGAAFFAITPSGTSPNSFYFRRCWFFEPPYYCLYGTSGDDWQIVDCTFDVTAQRFLGFGSASTTCTNIQVEGNTFFVGEPNAAICDLVNIRNMIFQGNRCYWDAIHPVLYAFQMLTNSPVSITGLIIDGNTFEGFVNIIVAGSVPTNVVVSNNTCISCSGVPIQFGGGVAVSGWNITGNSFSGFTGSGATGMIDATGTPITNSVISNNVIVANSGGTSGYCINLPQAGTTGNKVAGNVMSGFTTADLNIVIYTNNGCSVNGTFTMTMTGITGTTTGTARFTVRENAYTMFIPAISGTAAGTAITLTGIPAALQTGVAQNFALVGVLNNSANVAGSVQVQAASNVYNLFTGSNFAAFANTGNQGTAAQCITVQLA